MLPVKEQFTLPGTIFGSERGQKYLASGSKATKSIVMSKNELLEEFVKLPPAERDEVLEALCTLEEQRTLGAPTPSEEEMALLDRETEGNAE